MNHTSDNSKTPENGDKYALHLGENSNSNDLSSTAFSATDDPATVHETDPLANSSATPSERESSRRSPSPVDDRDRSYKKQRRSSRSPDDRDRHRDRESRDRDPRGDRDRNYRREDEGFYPTSRHLYISNLPYRMSAEELINIFKEFGPIEHASVIEGKNYGFVNFGNIKSAVKAKNAMDNVKLHGNTIRIKFSKGLPSKQLWIGNVHPDANDEELKRLFGRFGPIDIYERKRKTNCALITFHSQQDATDAMNNLQGKQHCSWSLKIGYGRIFDEEKQSGERYVGDDRDRDQPREEFSTRHLWVGNLSESITEKDIHDAFSPYGQIDKIKLFRDKGFGFVDFMKTAQAALAKQQLNDSKIKTAKITVRYAKGEPSRHLWVGNVGPQIPEDKLYSEFARFGKIENFFVKRDSKCAFIDFVDVDDALDAHSRLQGKVINGWSLKIDLGKPKMDEIEKEREERRERPPQENEPTNTLHLGLPSDFHVTNADLMREFQDFHPVSVKTWSNKPFAFVTFGSIEEAQTARRELTGKLFGLGDRIKINYNIARSYVPPIQAAMSRRRSLSPPRKRTRSRSLSSSRSRSPSPRRDMRARTPDSRSRSPPIRGRDYRNGRDRDDRHEPSTGSDWYDIEKDTEKPLKPIKSEPMEKRKSQADFSEPSKKPKVEQEEMIPPSSPVSPPSSPSAMPSAWSGSIAKSDIPICKAIAYPFGGPALSTIAPDGLPDSLNVKSRAALESIGQYINVSVATILKFQPENESDKRPFNDFIAYLKSKNRAGIAAGSSCNLYFIPAEHLGVSQPNVLLGVVVGTKKQPATNLNNILQQIISKP